MGRRCHPHRAEICSTLSQTRRRAGSRTSWPATPIDAAANSYPVDDDRSTTADAAATAIAPDGLPVDPALIAEAAALDEDAAAARHAELAGADRGGQPGLLRGGRADPDRRRVGPAASAGSSRSRPPGRPSITPESPTQRVGAQLARHLRRGPPPPADAVALERVQPRRAARVRHPRPARPRPAAGAGAGAGPDLRRRAEDRRPRDHPPLRARPVRPGRDPRRRDDRRGRHGEPADDHDACRRGSPSRRPSTPAARSTCRRPSSPGSTPSARSRACRSTRTRATPAPARSARRTRRSRPAASSARGRTS